MVQRIEIAYDEATGQLTVTGMPSNPILAHGILGVVGDLIRKNNTTGTGLVPPPVESPSGIRVVR